jgi:hypothetical protein
MIMKQHKDAVLMACAQFVPTLVEHGKSAHVNMPELLRYAAIEAFKQMNMIQGASSLDWSKGQACLTIQAGLRELSEKGFLEYGDYK